MLFFLADTIRGRALFDVRVDLYIILFEEIRYRRRSLKNLCVLTDLDRTYQAVFPGLTKLRSRNVQCTAYKADLRVGV